MIHRRVLSAVLLIASPCCAARAWAAELELRFAALERIIAAQLFTQDGRHYVRGSRDARCQFAYLEAPRIDSDQGRLRVRARFSGRSALDVLGRCVGLGDSFELTLTAAPAPRDGAIVLHEVNVSTPRDSYYIRRVRAALAQTISKDFKIDIRGQAQGLLEPHPGSPQPDALYRQELAQFDLGDIRVTPDALVLVIEFRVVIK